MVASASLTGRPEYSPRGMEDLEPDSNDMRAGPLSLCLIAAMAAGCRSAAPENSPAPGERPNILFVIADDASPHFGAYGTPWVKTPAFDRIANEGILFLNAYTPNAKCAPSRSAVLTGRHPWQLEAAANHVPVFPEKYGTYVEALRDNGYYVGYTGKGWGPGVAELNGKPRLLTGPAFEGRQIPPPTRGISPKDYAGNFRAFLDSVPAGQPFSFWFGTHEPHRAYQYGSGVSVGGKRLSDIPAVYPFWPDNDSIRNDMLDYGLEIEHVDRHLGEMLRALQESGRLENTLIVVTSDNGMPFPRGKGQAYELSNHMPLAVMWKAGIRSPGRKVTDFVSFIDFAPTFLEVAGVPRERTTMQPITGRSLTGIFRSERAGRVDPTRDYVLIDKERHDIGRPGDAGYPVRGIVTDGWLYLRNFEPERWPAGNPETGYLDTDGGVTKTWILNARRAGRDRHPWLWSFGKRPAEELFDLRRDSANMINLAERPELAGEKEALRSRLFDELRRLGDPRILGQGHFFEAYPYAHPELRSFFERRLRGEPVVAGWASPTDAETEPVVGTDRRR